MPLFAVFRTRGPAWQDARPLEGSGTSLLRTARIAPWNLRLGSL